MESNPEDADSFYAIETILSKQESSMKALPNFEKAVALDPTDAYNRSYYYGYLKNSAKKGNLKGSGSCSKAQPKDGGQPPPSNQRPIKASSDKPMTHALVYLVFFMAGLIGACGPRL